ncbi:MAG: competence/damage-inducible protein A [Spirochaetes bacterium]|nr:competence/damage-inducible protein A [Spirochaetota bacterium]
MNCSIVTIGTELLLGDIVNTNSAYISRKLAEYGVNVFAHYTVGDNMARILEVFDIAFRSCDTIITTGGLGPTEDDLTREAIAAYLGVKLVNDAESERGIREFFEKRNRSMSPSNLKQALFPESCIICANGRGTAPGAIVEHDKKTFIMLPGPPFELEHMFEKCIIPYIATKSSQVFKSRVIHFSGIGESEMNDQVSDLLAKYENPTIAPYAKSAACLLRITARASSLIDADKLIAPIEKEIVGRLGEYIFGFDEDTLESRVVDLLKQRRMTISCAESCTGGLLSAALVNCEGVSDVFSGSVITYSNKIKSQELLVDDEIFEKYGAVSTQCAEAMVLGCAEKFNTDIAVAITGIAGPDGGTEEKPVGRVYVAIYFKGEISVSQYDMPGDRMRIRMRTVNSVLFSLIKKLQEH